MRLKNDTHNNMKRKHIQNQERILENIDLAQSSKKQYTATGKLVLSISIILMAMLPLSAQVTVTTATPPAPLSPTAAALGKYGEVPVSLYTGIPNISIPLYDIAVKGFHLPISLSYHAGGIKVEDVPSWVGMGWSLNAGGVLNRQQQGIPDEKMTGPAAFSGDVASLLSSNFVKLDSTFWYNMIHFKSFTADLESAYSSQMSNINQGRYDTESDLYSLSCGNESAKFILDVNNQCHTIPASTYKIQNNGPINYSGNYKVSDFFNQWIVKNDRGIEFVYGKSRVDGISYMEISSPLGKSEPTVNSWFVNEIKFPSGEQIIFTYDTLSYNLKMNDTYTFPRDKADPIPIYSNYISYGKVLRLKEINFPTGKIVFVAGNQRRDLIADKVLDRIEIYSKESSGFVLNKTYKLITNNTTAGSSDDENFRLALLSVEEHSSNSNLNNTHKFDYYKQDKNNYGLPSRYSYSQDLWGYYNGSTNSTLSPIQLHFNSDDMLAWPSAGIAMNRAVDSEKSKYGVLTKVTYPTGGTTTFEYENNIGRALDNSASSCFQKALQVYTAVNHAATINKGVGAGVENKTGYDVAYSASFLLNPLSDNATFNTVRIDSHIMYDPNNVCTYSSIPDGSKQWYSLKITIEKQTSDGTYVIYIPDIPFNRTYSLECNNTYRLKFEWYDNFSPLKGLYAYVNASWQEQDKSLPTQSYDKNSELMVGGLRIKKISDYDPISQKRVIRKFSYNFTPDDGVTTTTSSVISNMPVRIFIDPKQPSELNLIWLGSFTNSSLYQTQGGNVGYGKVTVSYGENGENGHTTSYFTTAEQYPDINIVDSHYFPFRPIISMDWKRGLPLKTSTYSPLSYVPLKSEENQYEFYDGLTTKYKGIVSSICATTLYHVYPFFVPYSPYYLKKSTVSQALQGGTIITETSFKQSETSLATQFASTVASNTKTVKTITQYAADLVEGITTFSDASSIALRDMVSLRNCLTTPIESYSVTIQKDGSSYVTGGTLMTYQSGTLQPDRLYRLNISEPIPLSQFTPCKIVGGNFVKDSHYKEQEVYDRYDNSYNLLQRHDNSTVNTAYLWGYNKQYPVASLVNCDYDTAISVVSQDQIDAACSGSDAAALQTLLQNLRTDSRTKNAQITTYTYKPLIGITSKTDPRGVTTNYTYDTFNRLQAIKDLYGRVIQSFDYNYQH